MEIKKTYTSPIVEVMEFSFELAWGKKCVISGSDDCGAPAENQYK